MKKIINSFYVFVIVAIVAVNLHTVKSSSSNLFNLEMLKNALAECPEGTPVGNDEQNASMSCRIYCDNHDTSLAYHFVTGTQIICISGCTDCTPVDCDAKECTKQA